MFVLKRDSSIQPFNAEEIKRDIESFLTPSIQFPEILNELEKGLINHITTRQISDLLSNICASKISKHPDYNYLASAICIQKLHKETSSSYMETVEKLYNAEPQLVSKKLYSNVCKYKDQLEEAIDYKRDFLFDFFGLKTLERSYLKKIWNKSFEGIESNNQNRKDALGHNNEEFKFVHTSQIIERPQHLWMTVALGIHGEDIERAIETYHYMSKLYMIHATPTLFNASTNREQMSSCFIMDMEDNIENIFKTIGDVGQISKWAGGIGITLSRIRASGSKIKGTNGESSGLIPLCRTLNEVAKYINQGGKRNGSIACYLEPWHSDIYDFVELRKNTGDENRRARDLFLAIWTCDLFMKRVQNDEIWSLMCPSECPRLVDSYGEEFEKLYLQYESEGRYKKQIKAKDLWMHILDSQIETGMPYMTFKDNTNHKSNQKNVGVIKSSNLCSEICEYYDRENIAVCNLGSICLQRFVYRDTSNNFQYNYEELLKVARIMTRNLDRVIDANYYPVPETKNSNMSLRPIGLGVQGLSDLYQIMKLPYGSEQARQLNRNIFETIYFGALYESNRIAMEKGPYSRFEGSPFSQGQFQFHLWGLDETKLTCPILGIEKWKELQTSIVKYGTRNSLLTTCMPTASTSQIMRSTESFEPKTSNMYMRKTLSGEFIVMNEYLVKDLMELGLWTDAIRDEILYDQGSIQYIEEIPTVLKEVYKTAFEMKQKDIVQQSIERGPFIDQSQSLNLFMAEPNFNQLASSHFYGWKNGLKTGMYYLRTQPSTNPIQFGLSPEKIQEIKEKRMQKNEPIFEEKEEEPVYKNCPIRRDERGKIIICESCT